MDTPLTRWLGHTHSQSTLIDYPQVTKIAASLAQPMPDLNAPLPLLWHWGFFPTIVSTAALGKDGHPTDGTILPSTPENYQRMWAGGALIFHQPLIIDAMVERQSIIEAIDYKHGQNGALIFITLNHQYIQQSQLMLTETQTIVYRAPSTAKKNGPLAPQGQWSQHHTPCVLQLFRYSAVTFNSHRIHYDYPYATQIENYSNLVVHGPLLATWMVQGFLTAHPQATLTQLRYQGMRPTTLPYSVAACGRLTTQTQAEVWVTNNSGIIQQGQIEFIGPAAY